MKKYIDCETLVQLIRDKAHSLKREQNLYTSQSARAFDGLAKQIEEMPAADVAEVKHGEWILEREPNGKPYCFHCSICDDDFHYIGIKVAYDYCPNCGAKMDGE